MNRQIQLTHITHQVRRCAPTLSDSHPPIARSLTINGPRTFHIGLNVYTFTALMAILGIAWAFGKASVFKYISDEYPHNIGAISGIVGLAGRRHRPRG
jgi:nitrate/nitrite transporter NarK